MTVPATEFGQTLREIRVREMASLRELKRRSGVPIASLSRFESSHPAHARRPERSVVERIAHSIGTEQDLRDLLLAAKMAPDGSGIVELLTRLLDVVPHLSPADKTRLELSLDVLVTWAEAA